MSASREIDRRLLVAFAGLLTGDGSGADEPVRGGADALANAAENGARAVQFRGQRPYQEETNRAPRG